MSNCSRRLIYREWWIFPFMIAMAVVPWFMAAETIDALANGGGGWSLFAGAFGASVVGGVIYCVKLHREGRLFPGTKAEANANRARTLTARSYWPVWIAIAFAIIGDHLRFGSSGLGLSQGYLYR